MPRSDYYDDEIGLDFDDRPSRLFTMQWPISEVVLNTALNTGHSLEDIADEYDVTIADVIDLCEAYGLDFG